MDLIPKTKLELVLADAMVEKAVQAILAAARTGKIGDRKIFSDKSGRSNAHSQRGAG